MDLSFTFNGVSSADYGIQGSFVVPVLPEKRRNTVEVPGRDGVVDFGNNSYGPLVISGECRLKAASRAARDAALSSAALWLAGEGPLILGKSPAKRWPAAKVYGQIEPTYIGNVCRFALAFECSPPHLEDVEETTVEALVADTDYGSALPFAPVITIAKTGAAADTLMVSITSTGRYMLIQDDIAVDDVVVFDMASGKVTKNGQDIRSKLLIGSMPFMVPPGEQTIAVATNSTYTVSMTYRKRSWYA